MSFVRNLSAITNPTIHVRSLITAEGRTTKSTHMGKLQITPGNRPIFVSALVAPSFKDNFISVGQLTKANNVLFTNEGVFIQDKTYPNATAKLIGGRGSDNLYEISNEIANGTSSLHATPATLKVPPNLPLHNTLNHANPTTIQAFKRQYPNSAAFILNQLRKEKVHNSQSCTPCVIGKAKRKSFAEVKKKDGEALDAVATDTTGPVTPAYHTGNIYLQLIVDAATGHTQGFPMKKKSEAATMILKGIRRLELAV